MNPISNLGLLASLMLPATSMAQEREATLAQAQELFNQIDVNKDGKLSPAEVVARLQLSANATRGVDADQDAYWSKDEFLLFYRQRLVAAGKKPAADLENEATRILAARKAKATERNAQRSLSEARRAAQQAPAAGALSDTLDELEVKLSAGKAKDADFDHLRDLLVSEARAADQLAKGEDPAVGEKSDLHGQLLQTLERLRAAAASGRFSREEFQAFRAALVRRFRNAANGTDAGQGNTSATDSNAELRAIEQGLTEALDRLEQRAVAGNATPAEFDRVRDQLVARARAAANHANAPGAAEVELQGPLHRKMIQSLERLQAAAAAGTFSRDEYRAFRESIVQRFRNAENGGANGQPQAPAADDNAELRAIEQGLAEALDHLEQRAAAGNASREDYQRVRDQLIARARSAANGVNAATPPELEARDPVYRKLMRALDGLEAAAQQGTFSREEYKQLRDSMIHRAREIENPGQPRAVVVAAGSDEGGMNQSVDELQKRVDGGQVTPADFRKLRELIAGKVQAVAGKTDPESANEGIVYQKLMQALDRLEKAAQNGSVDRQEFLAFRESFIHRARQIANNSQPPSTAPNSPTSSTGGEQSSDGKRAGSPVATPPAAQPLPADKGAAKRADPARDAGNKGADNDPKPAPQPAPQPRPKPGGPEPEKPQPQPPPPQPPHRPAPESGDGKPAPGPGGAG